MTSAFLRIGTRDYRSRKCEMVFGINARPFVPQTKSKHERNKRRLKVRQQNVVMPRRLPCLKSVFIIQPSTSREHFS